LPPFFLEKTAFATFSRFLNYDILTFLKGKCGKDFRDRGDSGQAGNIK
jgi:hypothetical protein